MSRQEYKGVKTGGPMGQILDHMACSNDSKIRLQDGREALKLHIALGEDRDRLRLELDEAEMKIAEYEEVFEARICALTEKIKALVAREPSSHAMMAVPQKE